MWEFRGGLLKTMPAPTLQRQQSCLGPATARLSKEQRPSSTYPLTLQDCPDDEDEEADAISNNRHMRFVYDSKRQHFRSLAAVLDENGEDVMPYHPFCVTWMESGSYLSYVDLAPCILRAEEGESVDAHATARRQKFEAFGTAGPFLMPLRTAHGYSDQVFLAYQTALTLDPKTSVVAVRIVASAAFESYDADGGCHPVTGSVEFYVPKLLEMRDDPNYLDTRGFGGGTGTGTTGGVVTFSPSDMGVFGTTNASLIVEGGEDDDLVPGGDPPPTVAAAAASFVIAREGGADVVGSCGGGLSSSSGVSLVTSDHPGFVTLVVLVSLLICFTLPWRWVKSSTSSRNMFSKDEDSNSNAAIANAAAVPRRGNSSNNANDDDDGDDAKTVNEFDDEDDDDDDDDYDDVHGNDRMTDRFLPFEITKK
jgi:hypothetical protein